jgi:uncharacterized protein (DUF433 family)
MAPCRRQIKPHANRYEDLKRIVVDPKVMVGKPVIRGTRLTVQFILGMLAHGSTIEDIIGEYQGLTREDVLACIGFTKETLEHTDFIPLAVESP